MAKDQSNKMSRMLKEKSLEAQYDESGILILGSKKMLGIPSCSFTAELMTCEAKRERNVHTVNVMYGIYTWSTSEYKKIRTRKQTR